MSISMRDLGQMLMVGLPGTGLDPETRDMIREFGLCNFILFERNVEGGPGQARDLVRQVRSFCKESDLPPPLISTDQEGGAVQRLGPPHWPAIPGNGRVGAALDPLQAVEAQVDEIAGVLGTVGVNLNLAPVLDVCSPNEPGVLQGRTFGSDPRAVSYLGLAYIRKLQFLGIGATAKHFPGIGRVEEDPHERRPVVTADKDTVFREMAPFGHAVHMGVLAIMTSHVVYAGLDAGEPATFSRAIVTDLLRNSLNYNGVVMTDDLGMGGITRYGELGEAAVRAVKAGHDLLLVCRGGKDVPVCMEALAASVEQGEVQEEEVARHLKRVRNLRNLVVPGRS